MGGGFYHIYIYMYIHECMPAYLLTFLLASWLPALVKWAGDRTYMQPYYIHMYMFASIHMHLRLAGVIKHDGMVKEPSTAMPSPAKIFG